MKRGNSKLSEFVQFSPRCKNVFNMSVNYRVQAYLLFSMWTRNSKAKKEMRFFSEAKSSPQSPVIMYLTNISNNNRLGFESSIKVIYKEKCL